MRRLLLTAAVLSSAAFPAVAQDPGVNTRPDATITMQATSAAAGVGYSWGNGTLYFRGHRYGFSVSGLSIAAVGYAKIRAHGRVYHLTHVADFSGTYAVATGEATIGTGRGGDILRNGNGVMIRVDEITKGVNLAGSAGGIQLTLAQ